MNNTNIGYAFIGTPKGLQTKNGGIIEQVDIRRYIDLDNNIIKVDPGVELFSITKIVQNKDIFFFITQYEYAKEMESHRMGTFLGSTLVLKNAIAPAEAILLILSELMARLREYVGPDDRFLTTLDRLQLKTSKRLQGLTTTLAPSKIEASNITDQDLFIQLHGSNDFKVRTNFIHQCLHDKAFEPFKTVYASDSSALLSFIKTNQTMRTASISVNYETAIEKLEKHSRSLRQHIQQESSKLKKLTTEKTQLQQQLEQLNQKRITLTQKYSETERSITSNLAKLQELEKSLTINTRGLQKKHKKAEQKQALLVQKYETEQAQVEQQIEQLKSKLEQLQNSEQQAQQQLQHLQKKKSKLQNSNQQLMNDFELINRNLKQLEERNEATAATNDQLLQDKKDLESALHQLKEDLAALHILVEEKKAVYMEQEGIVEAQKVEAITPKVMPESRAALKAKVVAAPSLVAQE
ncbi:MAG: hypothetical protein AAF849_03355 [Bacteroidota bacterium]